MKNIELRDVWDNTLHIALYALIALALFMVTAHMGWAADDKLKFMKDEVVATAGEDSTVHWVALIGALVAGLVVFVTSQYNVMKAIITVVILFVFIEGIGAYIAA